MENKNLPAFPAHDGNMYYGGLTKREYASIMAMQSFIQKCAPDKNEEGEPKPNYELIAACSVDMADALLKALETPKQ